MNNLFDTLPHSLDAERSVLGSILKEPTLLDQCNIKPEHFYDGSIYGGRHKKIMQFIRYLEEIGEPVELVSMAKVADKELEQIGGVSYLMDLMGAAISTANFTHHQEIMSKLYIQRETIATLSRMAVEGLNASDTSKHISDTINALESLSRSSDAKKELKRIGDYTDQHEREVHKRIEQKGLTGAKSCSPEYNKMTGGHQYGDFTVTAARPSIGKTAFELNEAITSAGEYLKSGVNGCVVFFSLEMGANPIIERCISLIGNLPAEKMRTGHMDKEDWERYAMAKDRLNKLPMYFDQESNTLHEIDMTVKKLRKKYDYVHVIIDFLQLVKPDKDFPKGHEGVSYVSKGLKQISKKYTDENGGVTLDAISAVGRGVEQRQDKRPMMSDLRESGSIESDADIIRFLYRDDYYNVNSEKKHIVEVIIAKGRNVGTGTIEMAYMRGTSRFLPLDYSHSQQQKKG